MAASACAGPAQRVSRALSRGLPATHEVSSIITSALRPEEDTGEVTAKPRQVTGATNHEQSHWEGVGNVAKNTPLEGTLGAGQIPTQTPTACDNNAGDREGPVPKVLARLCVYDLLFNKGNASDGRKRGTYWKMKLIHKPTTPGRTFVY